MKKLILSVFLMFSLPSLANQEVMGGDKLTANRFNNQTFTVGDVKQSLLSLSQFQNLMGDCWVQMLGQDVVGSDYASITGKDNLPDARGRFLRIAGGNAPAVGVTQEDAFQSHKHKTSSAYTNTGLQLYGTYSPPSAVFNHGDGSSSSYGHLTSTAYTDGINGTPRQANETRPQNLGVNAFIKINHKCH